VAGWLDKVYTRVNPVVHNVDTVNFVLRVKVRVETLLNVVDDWAP
jgi:hypothetical protein